MRRYHPGEMNMKNQKANNEALVDELATTGGMRRNLCLNLVVTSTKVTSLLLGWEVGRWLG